MTFAGVSELTPGPGLPSGRTVTTKLDVAVMSDAELGHPRGGVLITVDPELLTKAVNMGPVRSTRISEAWTE